jgi:hypothetical protein
MEMHQTMYTDSSIVTVLHRLESLITVVLYVEKLDIQLDCAATWGENFASLFIERMQSEREHRFPHCHLFGNALQEHTFFHKVLQ